MVEVAANHPQIGYVGRVDCTRPLAPVFAYPGVSIRARFQGDSLDIRLKDSGEDGPQTTNYYNVIVDGGIPRVIQTSPRQELYPVARNLDQSEHTVEIWKRVEASPGGVLNAGRAEFRGLRLRKGAKLLPLAARTRRIEFVGDSITCGYGNELALDEPSHAHYTTKNSNGYMAWGAIAARELDADYVAVAYSGRGMYRNYRGAPEPRMPDLYLRIVPDDATSPKWNIASYSPHVVVINLGTNDFSPGGVNRHAFRKAYDSFLVSLRGYYPAASLLVAIGPMLSDTYPPGENAWTNVRADLKQIVASRRAHGDANIDTLFFDPQSPPFGEDWHPTVATHKAMAAQLVTHIKQLKGW